ncbi:MAG: triose-phosphate isomerase [Holosporaceae bacterium]|jgi:triosephosphate isomerase|nr:triose-phosphate isomerase [Holosporaceae bacterium]
MGIIAANWKMNGDFDFADKFIKEINIVNSKHIVIVCPPTVLIGRFRDFQYSVGAQNCFYEENGAFTGENSPKLLKIAGCEYVIVGHSERRSIFHETYDMIFKKWRAVIDHNMTPIVCIGERQEERSSWKEVISDQLDLFLKNTDFLNDTTSCFAYEPVWSIGTGLVPSLEEIEAILDFIKTLLGDKIPLLYGGSVNAKNAAQILSCKNVDGLLVGGASLKIDEFKTIVSI